MTRPGSNVGRMDRPFRPKPVDIHMANVKHPERKLEPMERHRWRWVGVLMFLCSAGMMIWLGFAMADWMAS